MNNTDNTSAPRRSQRNAGKKSEDLPAAVPKPDTSSTPPAAVENEPKRTTRSKSKGKRGGSTPAGEEDVDKEDAPGYEMGETITVSPRISREISRMAGGMGPPPRPRRSNGSTPSRNPFAPSSKPPVTSPLKKAPTKGSTAKVAASTPMQPSNDLAEEGEGLAPPTKASRVLKLKMTPKPKPDPSFSDYGDFLRNNIEGGEEMYQQQGGDEKFGTQEERVRERILDGLAERALAQIPDPVSSEDSQEGDDEEGDQDGEDEGGEDDEEGADMDED
ncbi:unnamed protein product [Zymoseptoria tritici ST99CH_1E4]|uniref:Uncharacterized protein n=1 Tax=Zymoseptoria tritici ST99CH_1E4 TaxID=1276532 RepID=A0A2H1GQ43_ZYMTR|nr:unnamed protein product [Zymoseptoria tritici ST99CH_1E4]